MKKSRMLEKYNYTLIRSSRKSIAIEMRPEGMVVRAPHRMTVLAVERFLEQKEAWIQKHYQKIIERQAVIDQIEPYTAEEIQELADRAAKVIPAKVKEYAAQIGVNYGRITIRCQRTRWGSCSGKGNLNFNCLLMLAPEEVLDSVVVHELCHRKYMNHSKQFYEEVEKVFPEYQRCHRWLKEYGSMMLSRLAK